MVLLLFFLIELFVFSLLVTQSFASLAIPLFFLLIGIFITKKPKKLQYKKDSSRYIFVLFLLIYSSFALLVYLYKQLYGLDFVGASDQINFYNQATQLGLSNHYFNIIRDGALMVLANWNGGSAIIFGTISFIAIHFFGGNNFLIQLFTVSFAASLTIVFLYKTLLYYFNEQDSRRYTIIFGFFSYLFYFSGFMLRDVFVALFYMIIIYTIHNDRFTIKTFLKLIIYFIITYSLRNENGLFASLFILIYIWKTTRTKKRKVVLISFGVIVLIVIFPLVYSIYSQASSDLERNQKYRTAHIQNASSSSLMKSVSKLPPVIKQISVVGFNLMSPFPFWSIFKGRIGDIIFLNYSFAGLFWYFVNGFIILSLIKYRGLPPISTLMKYLLIIALVYIFLNTAEIQVRRVMYVYPVIYIYFLTIYSKTKKDKKKSINEILFFFYLLLSLVYIFIKI